MTEDGECDCINNNSNVRIDFTDTRLFIQPSSVIAQP